MVESGGCFHDNVALLFWVQHSSSWSMGAAGTEEGKNQARLQPTEIWKDNASTHAHSSTGYHSAVHGDLSMFIIYKFIYEYMNLECINQRLPNHEYKHTKVPWLSEKFAEYFSKHLQSVSDIILCKAATKPNTNVYAHIQQGPQLKLLLNIISWLLQIKNHLWL